MRTSDKLDLGSVQIHKKVLAEIIATAMTDVKGVRLSPQTVGGKLFEIFGKKNFPGVEIRSKEEGDVSLQLNILVQYGVNIPDIARQVQDVVRSAVEKTADISLKEINVNIQGIERG